MKKYLICDFDSTIVSIETLDELAKLTMQGDNYDADLVQKIEDITEMGMQGKISFSQSLLMRVSLMNLHIDQVQEFVKTLQNTLTVSVVNNQKFIEKNADKIFIVSGGFRDVIVPVAKMIGIREDHVFGNEFDLDAEGNVIGFDVNNHLAQPLGKARQVEQLQLKGRAMMVGDGWTDYEVKQEQVADDFIAFTEHIYRDKVVEVADCVAKNFDEVVKYYKKS